MTQVDSYTIAPSPLNMAAHKTGLEAIFDALGSCNRGPGAPSNPMEGMLWWDTSTAGRETLKRYNGTLGWVALLRVDTASGGTTVPSGLSFGGVLYFDSDATLTANHTGRWITANMPAPSVITLPDSATIPLGAVIALRNWSAPVTVKRHTGGGITVAGEIVPEYVVPGGRNLFLTHEGNGYWDAWGDAAIPLASGTRAGLVLRAGSLDDGDDHYVPPSMLAGLDGVPVGTVLWHAAPTPPSGYLVCDGALISRSAYADLYARLGTTYGAGNGTTTFALPDLRGDFIRGWDGGRGADAGRAFGTAQRGSLAALDINLYAVLSASTALADPGAARAALGYDAPVPGDYASARLTGANASVAIPMPGNAEATAGITRPRNVALLPIIRY